MEGLWDWLRAALLHGPESLKYPSTVSPATSTPLLQTLVHISLSGKQLWTKSRASSLGQKCPRWVLGDKQSIRGQHSWEHVRFRQRWGDKSQEWVLMTGSDSEAGQVLLV